MASSFSIIPKEKTHRNKRAFRQCESSFQLCNWLEISTLSLFTIENKYPESPSNARGMKELILKRPWISFAIGQFFLESLIPLPKNCRSWERCIKKKHWLCKRLSSQIPDSRFYPKKWQNCPRYFQGKPQISSGNALNLCLFRSYFCRRPVSSIEMAYFTSFPTFSLNPWKAFFGESRFYPWRKRNNFADIILPVLDSAMFNTIWLPKSLKPEIQISDHGHRGSLASGSRFDGIIRKST